MIETKNKMIFELKNTKLVIGNGADLYCKMDTSYSDYFASKNEINNCLDDIIQLKSLCNKANSLSVLETINEKLTELIRKNVSVWYIYFYMDSSMNKLVTNNETRWCDVEYAMRKSFFKYELNKSFWDKIFDKLLVEFEKAYLDDLQIITTFIRIKKGHNAFTDIKNYYEYLLNELKIFENDFAMYLNSLFDSIDKISFYDMHKRDLFSRILTPYTRSIDTFNYTNPLFFYPNKNLNLTYWHINGSLEQNDEIIFGIDSNGVRPEDNEYIFTKTYRRMIRNANLPIVKDFNCDNVIIFGHSLNKQDYSYFFSLFDNLDLMNYSKKSTIVFAYHVYDSTKEDTIKKEFRDNVIKLISAYCNYRGNDKLPLIDTLSFQGRMILYEI